LSTQPARKSGIGVSELHDVRDMPLGNHQEVHGALGSYIVKSQHLPVSVDLAAREIALRYPAENAILHRGIIYDPRGARVCVPLRKAAY
jgi:hypothetical protein